MALPVPRELPVLPAPRARALLLLWNPDAKLEHFVAVAQGDPALTAAVLRAANSAASAPIAPIESAQEAIIRLGFESVKRITSAAIVRAQFEKLDESWLDVRELWRHLLAVALLAEASPQAPEQRSVAFTAGLLHDLGRLALAGMNPSRYAYVVELARDGMDPLDAERQVLGMTHASWGERLAEAWGLPERVAKVISDHHDESAEGLSAAVRDARALSWQLGIGDGVVAPKGLVHAEPEQPCASLESIGGPEALFERIRWFREAFGA